MQASQQIPVPGTVPHFGPNPGQIAVKVPTWLWIDAAAPEPVTVTAGTVSVTATMRLQRVVWTMGEPVDPEHPGRPADGVACPTAGTAPPDDVTLKTVPPCGYIYQWRSLKSRTNGTGAWPVTVTAHWVIDWASTTGEGGQVQVPEQTAATQLVVGEWRSELVCGSTCGDN